VSAVFSICADAAEDKKMKVKAAIAANVLDVAALLLMKRVEDADASLRQTLRRCIYSALLWLASNLPRRKNYLHRRGSFARSRCLCAAA
jgi:hypothetical protein